MLNRFFLLLVIICLFTLIPIVNGQSTCGEDAWLIDGECHTLDDPLSEGWHTVETEGETRCAHDTDYRLWVRPGNEHVLLYFQGGGGCWDQETCRQGSSFYKQSVASNEAITYESGIFDFDNPENPFAHYTMIFAPSCTGDVYMGSEVIDYGDEVIVHHRGFDNLMAAVNFTLDYAPEPESVFTAGCSAGSVGSAIAVPFLIEAYPKIPVTQLGDSLGMIFYNENDLSSLWGTPDFYTDTLAEFAPELSSFTLTDYYIGLAQAYPEHHFAQFNYRFDNVQQRYFAAGVGDPLSLVEAGLTTSLNTISAEVDNFSYFLADALNHCILPTADFYRRSADEISARDWIWSVANDGQVENVEE